VYYWSLRRGPHLRTMLAMDLSEYKRRHGWKGLKAVAGACKPREMAVARFYEVLNGRHRFTVPTALRIEAASRAVADDFDGDVMTAAELVGLADQVAS